MIFSQSKTLSCILGPYSDWNDSNAIPVVSEYEGVPTLTDGDHVEMIKCMHQNLGKYINNLLHVSSRISKLSYRYISRFFPCKNSTPIHIMNWKTSCNLYASILSEIISTSTSSESRTLQKYCRKAFSNAVVSIFRNKEISIARTPNMDCRNKFKQNFDPDIKEARRLLSRE